jgi:rifampicin phosphotransferase
MNKTVLVYRFSDKYIPDLSEVGGKGLSLIKGSKSDLPVPPGFVLTVEFFKSWFDLLKNTKNWENFLKSTESKTLSSICNELKKIASNFKFSPQQKELVLFYLNDYDENEIFAVRSSSPEEDLEGASFAGGYETLLGVKKDSIKNAVNKAFCSCLDNRVLMYKKENGFDVTDPKIAVVIQKQIASEISGVGFSINPITNNYDEAVINSNWGLGETVVSGNVTPDTYIVDKLTLVSKNVVKGKKEKTIWLNPDGGTVEKNEFSASEITLSKEQVAELTELIKNVETIYKKPMDIEWAYEDRNLYLLQARPVTAFAPIAPEMQTNPGEEKFLYQDMTISVQGLYKPISKLGTSLYVSVVKQLWKMLFKKEMELNPNSSLGWIAHGRMFSNLSNIFGFIGKEKFAYFIDNMDSLASKTILNIDEEEYKSKTVNKKLYMFRVFRIILKALPYILKALILPKHTHKVNQKKLDEFQERALSRFNSDEPITAFVDNLMYDFLKVAFKYSAPTAIFARFMMNKLKPQIKVAADSELNALEIALPNNVTTEMGISLSKLAQIMPENIDEGKLANELENETISSEFMKEWNKYLNEYGHRCPNELDPAAPRYRDDPKELIALLFSMQKLATDESAEDKFIRQDIERSEAFKSIYNKIKLKKGVIKAKIFKFKYSFIETFAGTRETHKYYLIYAVDLVRQRILIEGEKLFSEGRLNSKYQAFDLTLDELELGIKDSTVDLKKLAEEGTRFIKKLEKVPQLPTVFDSRGVILRPPVPETKEGEVAGTPVSTGIAKGKIKVLNTPTEKPFYHGEILVARATDPGWTPLFVNASAVILEVGGALQHGALVAREYGLPCVTGIENATSLWNDGDLVVVDGTSGIIRLLKD